MRDRSANAGVSGRERSAVSRVSLSSNGGVKGVATEDLEALDKLLAEPEERSALG